MSRTRAVLLMILPLLLAACAIRGGKVGADRVIADTVALAESGATRLRPEYVRDAIENSAGDERVSAAMQAALRGNSEMARRGLLRAVELKFIHDPNASALDLLGLELSDKYRRFDWDPADYPGGPEGPNEELASEMVDALRGEGGVFPERRANSGHDPVVRRSEATEDVWNYLEAELAAVPGQEDHRLNRHAVEPFVAMREAAARDGVELVILDADRSRARAQAGAARSGNPYAVASFSSHSLGLAIDFKMSQGDQRFEETTTRPMSAVVKMRESPVHKWLVLRGDEFGWYPYTHEPWHWEYNPPGFRQVFWQGFPGGAPEPPADTE